MWQLLALALGRSSVPQPSCSIYKHAHLERFRAFGSGRLLHSGTTCIRGGAPDLVDANCARVLKPPGSAAQCPAVCMTFIPYTYEHSYTLRPNLKSFTGIK